MMSSDHFSLSWLLEEQGWWLWAPETKHEVIRLLVVLAPKLEKEALKKLEDALLLGPPPDMYKDDIKPERRSLIKDRSIWLRLAKIDEAGVCLNKEAKEELDKLSIKYPKWELAKDQRDEFPFWIGQGHEESEFVATPRDGSELVEWLRQNPGTDGRQRDDWRERCRDNFEATSDALCSLVQEGKWPSERWREALQAWSEGKLLEQSWNKLAPILIAAPEDVLEDIARYVSQWLNSVAKIFEWRRAHFFILVKKILNLKHEDKLPANVEIYDVEDESEKRKKDPIGEAINHPVGDVTEALIFWWHRQSLKDNLGLDNKLRKIFTDLCDTKIEKYRHGRLFLTASAITLFRVDPEWTRENLLPLFSWRSSEEAYLAWRGFLWTPRLYLPLMDALKDEFLDTADPDNYCNLDDYGARYADFLTFTALDPGDTFTKKELAEAIRKLPKEGLSRSAQTLWEVLESSGEQRKDCWQNRIVPYIQDIWPQDNQGVDPEISENLGRLCIAAEENFSDALDILRPWLAPIRADYSYQIHALNASEVCKNDPEHALKFLDLIVDKETSSPSVEQLKDCLETIGEKAPHLKEASEYVKLNNLVRQHGGD